MRKNLIPELGKDSGSAHSRWASTVSLGWGHLIKPSTCQQTTHHLLHDSSWMRTGMKDWVCQLPRKQWSQWLLRLAWFKLDENSPARAASGKQWGSKIQTKRLISLHKLNRIVLLNPANIYKYTQVSCCSNENGRSGRENTRHSGTWRNHHLWWGQTKENEDSGDSPATRNTTKQEKLCEIPPKPRLEDIPSPQLQEIHLQGGS